MLTMSYWTLAHCSLSAKLFIFRFGFLSGKNLLMYPFLLNKYIYFFYALYMCYVAGLYRF